MSAIRSRLSAVAMLVLACQVAALTSGPIAVVRSSMGLDVDVCCQGLAPGKTCPMHHPREGDRTCKMRSACTRGDAALLSMAGGIGVLPAETQFVTDFDPGASLPAHPAIALFRVQTPESPPPRS